MYSSAKGACHLSKIYLLLSQYLLTTLAICKVMFDKNIQNDQK